MDNQRINSWEDLQKNVKRITVLLSKDENLRLAAASNPLFALEELGFEITPEFNGLIEDKIRFKTKEVERLSKLRESIFEHATRVFDIRSKRELNTVLFDELKLIAFDENGCPLNQNIPERNKKSKDLGDKLYEYEGLHPIIKPLIEFRDIDSTVPRLCDKETYQKIREGNNFVNSRIKLNIRLKAQKSQ